LNRANSWLRRVGSRLDALRRRHIGDFWCWWERAIAHVLKIEEQLKDKRDRPTKSSGVGVMLFWKRWFAIASKKALQA